MKRKSYNTERLIIRPYKMSDYNTWKRWGTNILSKKTKFDWKPPLAKNWNRKAFTKIVNRHSKLAKSDTTYIWPTFEKKTGNIVGFVDISVISRGPLQFANLGYRIDNHFWRQGFGKELLKKMIPSVLKDLRLQRLEAVIDLDNKPSIRLARSVGLKKESIRKNYYYQHQRWENQVVYVGTRKTFKLPVLHPK